MIKIGRLIIIAIVGYFFLASPLIAHTAWAQGFVTSEDADDFLDDKDWENDELSDPIEDPYESYNRFIFKLNNTLVDYLLEPVASGYDFLIPQKIQSSINNFFSNVSTPIRVFNNLFQKKGKAASTEVGRFVINTTIGVGGFFDPALGMFDIEKQDEDFGQTLGYYGMGSGPYIMWPLLGPSTLRDSIGFVGDLALNPLFWLNVLEVVDPEEALFAARTVKRINNYSHNIRDQYKAIRKRALDPYISLQHFYVETRKKEIEK